MLGSVSPRPVNSGVRSLDYSVRRYFMDKIDPQKIEVPEELKEYTKSFRVFVDEFKEESDRAAVIIGTAKLDYSLYQILTKYLVPSVSNSDELLEGDSPLSTFSARINICYRLGLIDSKFARALHLTRKIRNSFAHEVSGGKLDSGPHRDRIKELIAPFAQTEAFKDFRKAFAHDKTGAAGDFFTILTMMIMRLDAIFSNLPPLSPAKIYPLIPPGYEGVFKRLEASANKSDNGKSSKKGKRTKK
jgi:hypothetical protein